MECCSTPRFQLSTASFAWDKTFVTTNYQHHHHLSSLLLDHIILPCCLQLLSTNYMVQPVECGVVERGLVECMVACGGLGGLVSGE